MNLKVKKYFFFLLMIFSGLWLGYRISIIDFKNPEPTYIYGIVLSFLLIFIGSLYEWISIRKKLGDFN